MHPLDIPPTPSWFLPIAVGALATFAMLALFAAGMEAPVPALATASCCCCAAGFLPYGFLPAWIAARRDRHLTNGQGFAVAFIAVGLGSIVWAAIASGGLGDIDPGLLREAFVDARDQMPPERRMTDQEIDQMVAFAESAIPYIPAVYATVTTVLAGFVGMVTVGIARRRGAPPPADEDLGG